jgi:hypothetical protein
MHATRRLLAFLLAPTLALALTSAAPAADENLIGNADFNSGIGGAWDASSGALSYVQDVANDAHGCEGSGSLRNTSEPLVAGVWVATTFYCHDLGSTSGSLSAKLRYRSVGAPTLTIEYFNDFNCTGSLVGSGTASPAASPSDFGTGSVPAVDIPAPADSVRLSVSITVASASAVTLDVDHVYLGTPTSLFFDDFEGNGATPFCRWSSIAPP